MGFLPERSERGWGAGRLHPLSPPAAPSAEISRSASPGGSLLNVGTWTPTSPVRARGLAHRAGFEAAVQEARRALGLESGLHTLRSK